MKSSLEYIPISLLSSHPSPINVAAKSQNVTEALLSNLAHTPFLLDGMMYASVEAYWQGLKFPDESERRKIASMHGMASKKAGEKAEVNEYFVYQGVPYRVGSAEHHGLMKHAIEAKFAQNPEALELLLASGDTPIIHEPRRKDGSLSPDSKTIPANVFSTMLMDIRSTFRSLRERMCEMEKVVSKIV